MAHGTPLPVSPDDSEVALLLPRMLTVATIPMPRFRTINSDSTPILLTAARPFRWSSGSVRPPNSQANRAMFRISPLETVGDWASQDVALTHPNLVCLQANARGPLRDL